MKLDEIQNEIIEDSKVSDKLDQEALKIPYIYGKWINIHSTERAYLRRFKRDCDRLTLLKMDYYKGVSNPEYKDGKISPIKYSTNAEKERALSGDSEVLDQIDQIELQKIKIDAIENFLKLIHSMGFQIKNAIDYLKFKNGG